MIRVCEAMSNAFNSNGSDHGPLGSTESRSRGSRSPRSGSGASAPAVHRPDTPTSRTLRAVQQPGAGRPPEKTLHHRVQTLNDFLYIVKEHLWTWVHYRNSKEWADAMRQGVSSDFIAELKRTQDMRRELESTTKKLLRSLDHRSRGLVRQSEGEEAGQGGA